MNNVFRWVKYKLVEVEIHLDCTVYHVHLLGRVTLNMNICCLSQQVLGGFRTTYQLIDPLASIPRCDDDGAAYPGAQWVENV